MEDTEIEVMTTETEEATEVATMITTTAEAGVTEEMEAMEATINLDRITMMMTKVIPDHKLPNLLTEEEVLHLLDKDLNQCKSNLDLKMLSMLAT